MQTPKQMETAAAIDLTKLKLCQVREMERKTHVIDNNAKLIQCQTRAYIQNRYIASIIKRRFLLEWDFDSYIYIQH